MPGTQKNIQMMTDLHDPRVEAIDLKADLNYQFAISDIDPRLGSIKVSKVSWPSYEWNSGDALKEDEIIDMVECNSLDQNSD